MSPKSIEKISEGFSNQYLVQGMGVVAAGLLCLLISPFLAVPITIIGIALVSIQTGVLINTKEKSYKRYRNAFGIIFGRWKSLDTIVEVILVLNSDTKTLRGIMPGAVPIGRSAVIRTRTYDLYLSDGITKNKLNDFLKYKTAHRTASVICEVMNIQLQDKIADKIARNQSKKRR